MHKTRMIQMISSLLVTGMILTGCGTTDTTETTKAAGTEAAGAEETTAAAAAENYEFSLGTSSAGGNYYLIGSGWGNLISKEAENINVTSESTAGSTANLTMIENGEMDMGVTLGSSVYEAIEGEAEWTQGHKSENVRTLLPLYPSYLTMYALSKNDITDIYDLNGKSVGTGSLGAGVDSTAKAIFATLGIEVGSIHNDSHTNTAPNVGDGITEVGVSFQNPPYPALVELETSSDVTIIGMDQATQDKVLENLPYLFPGVIPAGSYKGSPEDVISVADWNWLVVSKDMPNEAVYQILETTFDNKEDLLNIHKATANVDMENYQYAATYLHPGVIEYLEDHDVPVADHLIPPAN